MQIERPHAGEHGVFHRAAEVGFREQGLLRLHAPTDVAPSAQEHPHGERTECTDHPEESAANSVFRGAVALRLDDEPIAHRRDRHRMLQRRAGPRQQVSHFRTVLQAARQHPVPVIDQRHRVARHDFGWHAKTHQPIHRVLAHDGARKATLLTEWHLQLQRGMARVLAQRTRIHRLAQVACEIERAVGVFVCEHGPGLTNQAGWGAG